MSYVEDLLEEYRTFVALPWQQNLAPDQRVWMAVYPPEHERRIRLHLPTSMSRPRTPVTRGRRSTSRRRSRLSRPDFDGDRSLRRTRDGSLREGDRSAERRVVGSREAAAAEYERMKR